MGFAGAVMRSWMIAFCLGIIGAAWLPQLPPLHWLPWLLPPLLLGLFLAPSRLPCVLLLGAWWLAWQGQRALEDWWPVTTAPSEVWVEGVVWSLPLPTEQGSRFRFRLERLCAAATLQDCEGGQWQTDERLLQLSSYVPLPLTPGQRWRWQVRLRRPHGFANPGSYDYEAWLLEQGISATGYVRDQGGTWLLAENSGRRVLERLRHRLLLALEEAGAGLERLPLVVALSLGEGHGIAPEQWDLFNRSGTNHLMVISGSHITLVAGLCLWLARWLWCRSAWLTLHCPAPVPAAALALVAAWFYTALAGFNLPAQRALVMSALSLGAMFLRRQGNLWQILLTALLIVLVCDPLAPQLPGFWLSFVAVAVLTLALLPETDGEGWWWRQAVMLVRSQGYVSVALLPLTGLLFQQVSWLSPLVNLVAIPLIGFLAVPLSLLSLLLAPLAPELARPLLQVTDAGLGYYLQLLSACDALAPTPLWTLPALLLIGRVLLVAWALGLLMANTHWQRLVFVCCLPVILLLRPAALPPGVVRLRILDVGQGTAIMISTRHHQLLYDAGPRYSARFDAGSRIVLPALRHAGVKQLDRVMISHADLDHYGGLDAVLGAYPTALSSTRYNTLYSSPEPGLFPPDTQEERCRAGQHWRWDGVDFTVLSPDVTGLSRNDDSCVLHIATARYTALLTGDIERRREHRLLAQRPLAPVDVLVAPHHGSATSSSPAFVSALQPAHVVYTTGYLNRYGHPAQPVRERYARRGVQAWYTMRGGALTVELGVEEGDLHFNEQRRQRARFWGAPLPPG